MANDSKGKGAADGGAPNIDSAPVGAVEAKAIAGADGKRKPKMVRCVIVHGGLLRDGVVEPPGAEFDEPEASAVELERDGVVQILTR